MSKRKRRHRKRAKASPSKPEPRTTSGPVPPPTPRTRPEPTEPKRTEEPSRDVPREAPRPSDERVAAKVTPAANTAVVQAAVQQAVPADKQRTQKKLAKTQFEKWALTYDRSLLNEVVFFPSIRICQEHVIRWQRARGGGAYRALDVGCGTGTLLATLARDDDAERLVGLDYAAEMVRRTALKFASGPFAGKLHAVNADAERLPFADESFDILACCNSFHHYPHQSAAVADFFRVLRPGGKLILVDGFRDNVIGWVIFDVAVETIEKEVHHCAWSEHRAFCEEAGFARVEQEKRGVLAPLLVTLADKQR